MVFYAGVSVLPSLRDFGYELYYLINVRRAYPYQARFVKLLTVGQTSESLSSSRLLRGKSMISLRTRGYAIDRTDKPVAPVRYIASETRDH